MLDVDDLRGPTSHSHFDFCVGILPCRFLIQAVCFVSGPALFQVFFCFSLIPVMGMWVCAEIRSAMRDRRGRPHPWDSTHGAQPRPGVCTSRRQSTPCVHGTGRAGISCKPMQQHIQSPGACVSWRARIDKCMASGAPADIQTYSAIRLLRYSHAISRRHVGPLLNKPPFASPDLALPI